MKSSLQALVLVASLLSAPVAGLVLQKRQDTTPRVVSMTTERKQVSDPVKRDRIRRRGAVTASLDNEETLYFINATLGTPAQSLRLHLDTGSSDLWVNTPSSTLCQKKSNPCSWAGTYNANASSTYDYVGSYFDISYVDGSGASGDYVTDTITIGSTTLSQLQFGIGYNSTSSEGILGIGYESNEVQVSRADKAAYKNLPSQLAADGTIASNAYSLWLNDLDASTGSILFGGVDTSQYSGELQTLAVQSVNGGFSEFLITLTGLTFGNSVIGSDLATAVLLDSGSSLTYLPDAMAATIFDDVGAVYDADEGVAYVACALADNDTSLVFTFSAPTIVVAMDELVLDILGSNGQRPKLSNGEDACLFGIAAAGTSTNVLGDTFLRSAYVVYDLDNNEISLAQTVFNTTSTSVVEIASGASGVPDATAVADAVSATGLSNSGVSSAGTAQIARQAPTLLALLAVASSLLAGIFAV